MTYLTGIDVAKYQGAPNYDLVLSSNLVSFAFCKATEGVGYVDPQFARNWSEIKRVGLCRGTYHFAKLGDPVAEANYFISTIGSVEKGDMLCLDIEKENSLSGDQFTAWVLTWCETVLAKTGIKPIIYTGGPFFNQHQGKPSQEVMARIASFPLWLAAYTNNPDNFLPIEYKDLGWTFWQATGDVAPSGATVLHVPGISTVVDRDYFKGSLDDLKAFAASLYVEQPKPTTEASARAPAIADVGNLFDKGIKE